MEKPLEQSVKLISCHQLKLNVLSSLGIFCYSTSDLMLILSLPGVTAVQSHVLFTH